ncbi:MAG TPA: LptF/LptG family permease [Vicinamibacterales bacterium]
MLKSLDRYVIREILPPLFLSLLVFTFILELPPVMEQLESLVAKGVSWSIAGQILLTLIPQALGLTIPMSVLVGLLIGLGRMSGDREAVALLACGVSPYRLLRPVLLVAFAAAAVNLYVMIWAIPNANQAFRNITFKVVSKRVENDVKPQVFFQEFPGLVLYARDIPRDGSGWKDVLVADTKDPNAVKLYMAAHGTLSIDPGKQTVALVLRDGMRYANSGPDGRQIETYGFPGELTVQLDPQSVFPRIESGLQRGDREMTIAQLRQRAADKAAHGLPIHEELIYIQQKFSFPAACFVFVLIGLALGLTVARDGKLAGFVVGVGVIFVYYVLLYVSDAVTLGYYATAGARGTHLLAELTRWVPNIVLFAFGVFALIWRARWAEGRVPFRSVVRLTTAATAWISSWRERTDAAAAAGAPGARGPAPSASQGRVVVVVRVPRMWWTIPTILDRYVSRIYLRTAALSCVALLGIFYISNFIDRSDKLFKGQATGAMMVRLLALMTPQFVYYVIPLAALLSVLVTFAALNRSSELSVMKACGISLYRIAAPLLLLSVVWSGVLYGLEQQIMARANERAADLDAEIRGRPRLSNPLGRQWLVAKNGDIYHYSYFDPTRKSLTNLAVYRPEPGRWQLASELYTARAAYASGRWTSARGWQQGFNASTMSWTSFTGRMLPLEPPDYFGTEALSPDLMTVPELRRYVEELSASGFNAAPLMVELQKKLAFPCVTIVMTLLAIPFGLTMGKRGTLYGIGIAIVLGMSYWVVGNAFAAIGQSGLLGPILAGWAPNVIAAGSAAYLLLTART